LLRYDVPQRTFNNLPPKNFTYPPYTSCPWEGSLLHITTPHTNWDVGVLPHSQRGRPWKSVASLGKRKLPHPVITLLSPVITLFTLLTIFLFTIKAKTTWP